MAYIKYLLLPCLFLVSTNALSEWIDFADPIHKDASITFSTTSIKRVDEFHISVMVFTNYRNAQTIELNKRKVEYQSKSETQLFSCEDQEFAIGDADLFKDRDAQGGKTLYSQKELVWKPILDKTLQMAFINRFCARR